MCWLSDNQFFGIFIEPQAPDMLTLSMLEGDRARPGDKTKPSRMAGQQLAGLRSAGGW
jgi:hypothetical protein